MNQSLSDSWHNHYECPNCDEWVSVPLPLSKYIDCPHCKTQLEIHPDADFEDGQWHDRTTLSIVDEERQHMKRMLRFIKQHDQT